MSTITCNEPECRDLKTFSRSAELRRHQKEFHGPLQLCPYAYCSWGGTKRLSRYKDHINKHHCATTDIVLKVPQGFSEYATATQNNRNGNQPQPASLYFDQSYAYNGVSDYSPRPNHMAAPESLSPWSNASNIIQRHTPPRIPLQALSSSQYYNLNIPEAIYYGGDENVGNHADFTLYYNSQPSPDPPGGYGGEFDRDAAL